MHDGREGRETVRDRGQAGSERNCLLDTAGPSAHERTAAVVAAPDQAGPPCSMEGKGLTTQPLTEEPDSQWLLEEGRAVFFKGLAPSNPQFSSARPLPLLIV